MNKPKLKAAYQLKANPPHMGNILEIIFHMNRFKKIYIVVYDKPTLLSSDQCIEMLKCVLDKMSKTKFVFIKSEVDFEHMSTFPIELLEAKVTHIITSSERVIANLKSKGFPFITFVPHPTGFYDDYQSIAYSRGFTLDRVRSNFQFR